ncbi:MAG: PAS domain S-box protein, partial [Spirochaetia bacterium]
MDAREFQSIVEDAAAATAVVRGGRIIYANNVFKRMFGGAAGQSFIGQSAGALFDPEEWSSIGPQLEETGSAGSLPVALESTAVRAGGTRFPVIVASSRVSLSEGPATTIVLTDISRRKQVEERLAHQAGLVDDAIDPIIVRDMDDRLLCWNRAAELMFGWSYDEAKSIPMQDFVVPEDWERLHEARTALLADGHWEGELSFFARDRHRLIAQIRMALMRNASGTPVSRMVSARDITAQRAVEAQFLRAQRMESIGTLAGGIAHDLNNVLAPILMGVESVSLLHTDEQTRATLDIIRSSAQRGAGIVRQVLGFARGLGEKKGEILAWHILREIEQILTRTFPKSIEITTRIPRDLWTILGDSTHLHQV